MDSLTYREKIRDCAHLTRELVEHLELAVVPKVDRIKNVIRVRNSPVDDDIPDVTVRNLVATLLESEDFAAGLLQRLDEYSQAIVRESEDVMNPKSRRGS